MGHRPHTTAAPREHTLNRAFYRLCGPDTSETVSFQRFFVRRYMCAVGGLPVPVNAKVQGSRG